MSKGEGSWGHRILRIPDRGPSTVTESIVDGTPYDPPLHYPACSAPTRKPKVKPEGWDAWDHTRQDQYRLNESGCWETVRWEVSWNYVTGRKGRISDQARKYCDRHAREWCLAHEIPLPVELTLEVTKVDPPAKKEAFLCFNDWAGYRERPVRVVGETQARYRIEADETIRLAGRRKYLEVGKTALVPKTAIRWKEPSEGRPSLA